MSEDLIARLQTDLDQPPFHAFLEPRVEDAAAEPGTATIRLPYKDAFRRRSEQPEYHGGVISAFIDLVGHAAVAARVGHGVPTINLRIDYLRMASGDLTGVGRVVRAGRTIAIVDVEIADASGRLVALGRGTFSTREG